jgi:ABC-type Fe3+-hydroxamate transport system substrate-binding protein
MFLAMNKISFAFIFLALVFFACNNTDKKTDTGNDASKTLADSLESEVMDGHNVGMAKYGKLTAMQNEAQRLLDSIAKLPQKAREAMTPLKTKLEVLVEDLRAAKSGMDKWMEEYNMDSAVNNIEQRINYLTEEKIKVSKVKESILNSLQKADSVLKSRL